MAEGDSQDDSQKTEEPTQKRIEDARKKGQIAFSREVSSFFILLVLCILLIGLFPYLMKQFAVTFYPFLNRPHDMVTSAGGIWLISAGLLEDLALIMIIPFAMTVTAALVAGAMQTRFNVSLDRIKPKLEKISLLKGFKRLFSLKNFVEFLKGIFKIVIVGVVGYLAVAPYLDYLRLLPSYDMSNLLEFTMKMAIRIAVGMTLIMFLIAIVDYMYQRFEYLKNLRMTKQEIKDEYKQQEGDPLIKSKLRQIRMERAKKRMMANVPDADVVVTNPTHYAIALSYESDSMKAPIVLAKGKDKVAHRIREIAEEHRIPVFRNPIVARALFDNAELDEEIPIEHYEAVAKIIGYVYKMQGKIPKQARQS